MQMRLSSFQFATDSALNAVCLYCLIAYIAHYSHYAVFSASVFRSLFIPCNVLSQRVSLTIHTVQCSQPAYFAHYSYCAVFSASVYRSLFTLCSVLSQRVSFSCHRVFFFLFTGVCLSVTELCLHVTQRSALQSRSVVSS